MCAARLSTDPPSDAVQRLQKFLAAAGVASRRASERLIIDGHISVNGAVVRELGTSVNPAADRVELDGRPVRLPTATRTVVLHKPVAVISSASDPRGRRTVLDLVQADVRLYPVGRLDYDSEGLILLTSDGVLAHRLTHPGSAVEKEYVVHVVGSLSAEAIERLRRGIPLDGTVTQPAVVQVVGQHARGDIVRFVLREGRNRQIRRMLQVEGLEAARLTRVRIDGVRLGSLRPGDWRELSAREVAGLKGMP
ncbi:MAG: pseudouridine synthase [Chloroflexota bacterium]